MRKIPRHDVPVRLERRHDGELVPRGDAGIDVGLPNDVRDLPAMPVVHDIFPISLAVCSMRICITIMKLMKCEFHI